MSATAHAIPEALCAALRAARHVAVLTGAGVSAESGIATFRDAQTGLWERFDAAELATPAAFLRDRALVWGWYEWRRMRVLRAQPNPAHLAIAALADRVPRFTLITQNVDDLHERAGSREVLHLHGSLHAPRCFDCEAPYALPPGVPAEPEGGRRLAPPRCPRCGAAVRPGVVWFGEALPADAWQAARDAVAACDLLLTAGTSGLVQPAAGLPGSARRRGATVVLVNPVATELDATAHYLLRGKAGELLPAMLAAAFGAGEERNTT